MRPAIKLTVNYQTGQAKKEIDFKGTLDDFQRRLTEIKNEQLIIYSDYNSIARDSKGLVIKPSDTKRNKKIIDNALALYVKVEELLLDIGELLSYVKKSSPEDRRLSSFKTQLGPIKMYWQERPEFKKAA